MPAVVAKVASQALVCFQFESLMSSTNTKQWRVVSGKVELLWFLELNVTLYFTQCHHALLHFRIKIVNSPQKYLVEKINFQSY